MCVVFAQSPPYPTVFFASVKEIATHHRDQFTRGRKTIMASFEEFIVKLCIVIIALFNMAFAAYVQENTILVLSWGGEFAHFFNLPAPLWGIYSCSKKKKRQMPGGRGMGMGILGIDVAINSK